MLPEPRFQVGDQILFTAGTRTIQGVVTEDRGPIGVKGRQLYRVEFREGADGELVRHIELPAVQMQLVRDSVSIE